jgi:hypothetical protein
MVIREQPPELLEARRRAARASARARRQAAAESVYVTIKIQPAHQLSPEQLAAWRSFWRAVLATAPEFPVANEEQPEGGAT